jgi:hypothetical protein
MRPHGVPPGVRVTVRVGVSVAVSAPTWVFVGEGVVVTCPTGVPFVGVGQVTFGDGTHTVAVGLAGVWVIVWVKFTVIVGNGVVVTVLVLVGVLVFTVFVAVAVKFTVIVGTAVWVIVWVKLIVIVGIAVSVGVGQLPPQGVGVRVTGGVRVGWFGFCPCAS